MIGGEVAFHRHSTSKLELRANWADYRADIVPRPNDEGDYAFFPLRDQQSILIENIAYDPPAQMPADNFDLVFDDLGKPRFLSMNLTGGHARNVEVSVIATSRFSSAFKEKDGNPVDGTISRATVSKIAFPATGRPDKVALSAISSVLHEDGGRIFDIEALSAGLPLLPLSRKVMIRLDLGTSWYSSGEGERLGVVLWPPDLSKQFQRPSDSPDYYLEHVPDFATCWGRDPIRLTADVPRLLFESSLANCTGIATAMVPTLPKYDGEANTKRDAPQPDLTRCVLALFDPIVDPVTGHFYADIEIDEGNSYNAFVRLGLVRYQSNCLKSELSGDLEVSYPIETVVSVMPTRKLEARASETGGLLINYSGGGYSAQDHGLLSPQQAAAAKLGVSTIDVMVLRRGPGHDRSGVPAATLSSAGAGIAQKEDIEPTAVSPEFGFAWEFQIDVVERGQICPICRDREQIVLDQDDANDGFTVLIREREHYMADSANDGPWDDAVANVAGPLNTKVVSRVVSSIAVKVTGALATAKN